MFKNKWFVIGVRSIAAFLLFLAAAVLISILNPVTTPIQQESYMMGMMSAMMHSLMGSMCNIAHENGSLNFTLSFLALAFLMIVIPLSIATGLRLRRWRMAHENK